ncbi:DUF1634 domain-containing protein [Pyrobaculum sp. 3827-6]|uniref:DUF1634 domain-containing protein n=1 Tax=Pyrobaculum sp. 3827-6 TaxID=2983604 RepID=UPI0021D9395E|nr:DUF1634 domain-containing protein [Pyrobaculum sp. 3827-6]MCU7787579.1 DUF1634 domain-containing protein [Pyrobaculum sp. 3827-6]
MDLEDVIGYTLRIGVIISIVLIATGVVLLVVKPPAPHILQQLSNPRSLINTSSISPTQVLSGSAALNGLDVILLGLIVLIATPVLRVVMGLIQFAKERNYIYVAITTIVLFNLLFAIFIIPILLK